MLEDEVIDRGLKAYQRKQQRLTDRADRAALRERIIAAGPGGLVLDARYGIRLECQPGPLRSWGVEDE